MTNDLVSIIIPVYNVAPYLDRCVQSACNQTYKNIEIILVDDGSTDESGKICDRWAKTDDRIIVIHQKNSGVSAARNTGLDIAKGKYISFLDSDDEYLDNTIEIAISNFSDEIELVSFGYTIYSMSLTKGEAVRFEEKVYCNESALERYRFVVGPVFKFELGWNVWNNVFLKSIIEKNNLRFPIGFNMAEDQLFCLLYSSFCKMISVIDDLLYKYYRRENSLTSTDKRTHTHKFADKNDLAIIARQIYLDNNMQIFDGHFSTIYYLLLERLIQDEENKRTKGLRRIVIDQIRAKSSYDFFQFNLAQFIEKDYKKLESEYDLLHVFEKRCRAKWLLTGHSFWYTVLVKIRKMLFI